MEQQNNQPKVKSGMKKRMLTAALALCCLAVLATGTLAYFTAEETAQNVITMGSLKMELVELNEEGKPWTNVENIVPGMEVTKKAYVENNGTVYFYTRVKITKSFVNEQGEKLPDLNTDLVELDLGEDWELDEDGFYYYKKLVAPGEETEPLFTTVTFSTEMGNEYQNVKVKIDLDAQAVQSRNNGESALEATGWPESEEGGEA